MLWAGPGPTRLTFRKLRFEPRWGYERLRGPGIPTETTRDRAGVGGSFTRVCCRSSRLSDIRIHLSRRPAENSGGAGTAAAA